MSNFKWITYLPTITLVTKVDRIIFQLGRIVVLHNVS